MLSVIRNSLKSLTVRFLAVYLISLLVLLAAFVGLITTINTQEAYNAINRTLEVGAGYLEGFTPVSTGSPPNSYYTAERIINEFTPFSVRAASGSTIDAASKYTILGHEPTGPVTIYSNDFPGTFEFGFMNISAYKSFYYYQVPGFDNVLLVASVDYEAVQKLDVADRIWNQAFYLLPVLLILAAVFGRFVAWRTVDPVISIARATESMNEKNLSERVRVTSSDEIGRLARSFNHMADRLESAFTAQKLFISDAAHELRTPLASMKTAVTYALSQPDVEPERQQLLIGLSSRLETMERLINDLLLQARADEAETTATDRLVNVAAIVAETAEAFQPLFEENGIRFSLNMDGLSPGKRLYVKGDSKQLLRLFSNLLDNATKNTPAGGEVSLEVTTDGVKVIIKVNDTGCGIAPEHLDKIFDRFYKISADRAPESGFGLGLSVCRGIVTRHGGEISVVSILAKGSFFTVHLPLVKE